MTGSIPQRNRKMELVAGSLLAVGVYLAAYAQYLWSGELFLAAVSVYLAGLAVDVWTSLRLRSAWRLGWRIVIDLFAMPLAWAGFALAVPAIRTGTDPQWFFIAVYLALMFMASATAMMDWRPNQLQELE